MDWDGIRGFVGTKIQANNDIRIKRILSPALRSRKENEHQISHLNKIGSLVGLAENEVRSVTDYRIGAVSRFCSRMLFIIVLGFFVLIMLSMAAADNGWTLWEIFQENPTTTYTPGTRYGSIHPSDFG